MKEFLDFIVDYGFMTVFSGLSLFLLFEYVRNKLHITRRVIRSPKDHMFFLTIERYRKMTVKRMRVYHSDKKKCKFVQDQGYCKGCEICTSSFFAPGRTLLVRKLLDIKFKEWRKGIYEATSDAINTESFKEVLNIYTDSIIRLVNNYESEWRNEGIPEIVIQKFNEWHKSHVKVFINGVEQACTGKSFSSIEEVCNSILHLSEGLVVQTILDAERTLGKLNGELSGKKVVIDGKKYIIE